MKAAALVAAALTSVTCGAERPKLPPSGQLVIYVTTDAPLPPAPGESLGVDDAPPLFDRLRVELFAPGESTPCPGCTREFAPDRKQMNSGKTSFGFVPRAGLAGYRVRVRLFRGLGRPGADPRPTSTLDTTASLPVTGADGIVEVSVHLATDDVATPIGDLDAPVPAIAGVVKPNAITPWEKAIRKGCGSSPKPNEVCIPGGTFWMGDPRFDQTGDPDYFAGRAERLVTLSPFYLDLTETTVKEFRAADALRLQGSTDGPDPTLNNPPDPVDQYCTYTVAPGAFEDLPVNCILWSGATAYCEKVSKRLPTTAELEYVQGALTSQRYIWGEDPPSCGDAVYGREPQGACEGRPYKVDKPGTGLRDRLELGGLAIVDLSGNLSEWVADYYQADREPCWKPTVLTNPVCNDQSPLFLRKRSIHGASFNQSAALTRAAARGFLQENFERGADVGFRCARDGR